MLVLKSTHNQMIAEAKASGAAAMREMIGELTDGLQALGLRAEPRFGETTAQMILRQIKAQQIAADQFRDELAAARNTLKATTTRLARLTTRGPGGRFVKPPVAAAEMGAGL